MRIPEPIETKGTFWLPGQPETQLTGILRISESGRVTVEVTGPFDHPLVPRNVGERVGDRGRIVGRLQDGGHTTLDGCVWQRNSISYSSGLSTSHINVSVALIGAEYEEWEVPSFSDIYLSVEGLETWLSISGIEPITDVSNNSGVIRYHLPDDISLSLAQGIKLGFAFSMRFPTVSLVITEASVTQSSFVSVKLEEPQPIEFFSSLAVKVCNFLSLALDEPVCVQSITGYVDLETSRNVMRRLPVKIYGQFPPWSERKPTIDRHEALFTYPDVASKLNDILVKWFEYHDIFEPAFNLYFSSRVQSFQLLEAKILWLTQALETLHRRSSTEKLLSDDELAGLRDSLVEHCPQNRRSWLKEELRYANELSFRQRVKRLLKPFSNWFGSREERRILVNTVCDTRNYLTHYDETNTKNRAIGGRDLVKLHGKLEALFQLHLLRLTGLNDSDIDSIVHGNRSLIRKLGA